MYSIWSLIKLTFVYDICQANSLLTQKFLTLLEHCFKTVLFKSSPVTFFDKEEKDEAVHIPLLSCYI